LSNAITTKKREKNQPGKTTEINEWASQEEAVLAFREDFEGVCTIPEVEGYGIKIKSVQDDSISITQYKSSGEKEIKVPYSEAEITIDRRTFATVVEINGITLTANCYSREKSKKLYNYLSTLVEMENNRNNSYASYSCG